MADLSSLRNLCQQSNFSLFLLRLGVGGLLGIQGCLKFSGGLEPLRWVGLQLQHVGIHLPTDSALPIVAGICAALAESLGGVLLILGWFTRTAAFVLAFTMLVAVLTQLSAYGLSFTDPVKFAGVFFPGLLGLSCVSLFFSGPGGWSISKD